MLLAPSLEDAEGLEKRARLVQPDIPQDVKWEPAFVDETMNRLIRLSYTSPEEVDLIVWPEAAVPFFLERSPGWDAWPQRVGAARNMTRQTPHVMRTVWKDELST